MRGRGGRGGRGRGYRDESGPVTVEAAAFPPNPSLHKREPCLQESEQFVVALNRILINYWKLQSPFQVQDKPEVLGVQTYSGSLRLAAATNPATQKDLITSFAGPNYFPTELLVDKYVPPRAQRATTRKKRAAPTGAAEGESGAVRDAAGDDNEQPEVDDFGGDDYAHDHYADEDKEDFDEGGGDNDEVF